MSEISKINFGVFLLMEAVSNGSKLLGPNRSVIFVEEAEDNQNDWQNAQDICTESQTNCNLLDFMVAVFENESVGNCPERENGTDDLNPG